MAPGKDTSGKDGSRGRQLGLSLVGSGLEVRRAASATPRAAGTRRRAVPEARDRAHRLFGILSLLLVVGLGITLFMTSSAFGVSEIVVVGSSHLSSADVVRLCDVALGANIMKVSTGAIRDRLLACPRVAEATVSRRLPGTLVVRLVEREGVALLPCGQQFAELDASGLPVEFHRLIGALGLPVITGVATAGVTLGTRVEGAGAAAALGAAEALGTAGRARISEVDIDAAGEVVLYTRAGIPVYIGPAIGLDAKVKALLGILADIEESGLAASYVDVRYPRYPVVGSAGGPTQPAEWQWADPDVFPVIGEP